ncbi:MAG: tetratricopeptide repeat protein, partial [Pseudomonadales bacterium]|nr:tetratricopeptide repeat protein [Pseudomonadales bacterium]
MTKKEPQARVLNSKEKVISSLSERHTLEIKHAYDQFLEHAPEDSSYRKMAIRRLADIELEISRNAADHHENEERELTADISQESLQLLLNPLALYKDLLLKFPNAKNNDEILYRLAHISEKIGNTTQSIAYLERLVREFSKSAYFDEAQFRIAEKMFANGHYSRAEVAYSEVIFSQKRSIFYERSLFKRGWCRYKQHYYDEAVDDYLLAIGVLKDSAEKQAFLETKSAKYYKAIALAFSQHGDKKAIEKYFQQEVPEAQIYKIYQQVAFLYLGQHRYFDAATLYAYFLELHPDSVFYFEAFNENVKIWKESGFKNKFIESIEDFYFAYRPVDENNARRVRVNQSTITPLLERYGLAIASHYHELALEQLSEKKAIFHVNAEKSEQWYLRFIEDLSTTETAVTTFYQYAELLVQMEQLEKALLFYQKAAYENKYLKHREAAYALVTLIGSVPETKGDEKHAWLLSQIEAAEKFCSHFPSDVRAGSVAVHVGGNAANSGKFTQSIHLLEACRGSGVILNNNFRIVLANSYFELADFSNSEKIFTEALNEKNLSKIQKKVLNERLALSIFRQGELAQDNGNIEMSIAHFSRIAGLLPQSSVAAMGLYQAISISMSSGEFQQAIEMSKRFRSLFPQNKFTPDVLKSLSIAYLNT